MTVRDKRPATRKLLLKSLFNRLFWITLFLSLLCLLGMPVGFRFWFAVMRISPSVLAAWFGLVLGTVGFFITVSLFFRDISRAARNRRLPPEQRAEFRASPWHFPLHAAALYLVVLPTAVCLIARPAVGSSPANWDKAESVVMPKLWKHVLLQD